MSTYQTDRYTVVLINGAYAVQNIHGKVYRDRLTFGEACALADLYQGDDDYNDAEERQCAREENLDDRGNGPYDPEDYCE
jgi:hypothetical protein